MSQKKRWRWNGWSSVYRIIFFLFSLLVLAAISPALIELLYVGHPGARAASCQSNLKQLGLALTQYEQDSDELQPPVTSAGNGWREDVFPYVKSFGVYECPDYVRKGDVASTSLAECYSANHLGPDGRGRERGAFAGIGEAPVNLFQLEHPASTILLTDSRGDQDEQWDMIDLGFLPQTDTTRELHTHVPRHIFYEHPKGTLNVLLVDGHVKRLYPLNTLMPVNLWTRDNAPFTGQDQSTARAILQHAQDE